MLLRLLVARKACSCGYSSHEKLAPAITRLKKKETTDTGHPETENSSDTNANGTTTLPDDSGTTGTMDSKGTTNKPNATKNKADRVTASDVLSNDSNQTEQTNSSKQ
ncbi:hypothetical protein IW492_12205 [Enterococcus sp. BWB1-3]|uniref:hypothetical protein n=1 Tax=Enterococcus sp. BWB1-3 TaxID=2787713 RepID=UPI001924DF91|nr:hypothetical protein [Enterococcus sp. BWB1-3]MBL1229996.1 hypothetical protein [Enterococcus sp. BWB1-3]